ncbi:CU044_5270 family protein [Kribbella catacumbae]|uniref:CU044_5270 family protein n=1 Tax=Kribbella catacumbae TaxID=460086 RepID=UPI0003620278|nr:CU044_5270 family protein [Kribbella catacumbae]
MNELDLLKQVRNDVPDPDPVVLARARQRLLSPPPVRRTTRPRVLVAAALTLPLAGGFLAVDVISPDKSPLPGTVADASTFLADAAAQAAAHPEAPIPPGQYRQVTTLQTYIYEFGPDHKFRATTLMQVDEWLPADATRQHLERVLSPVRVDFATPEAKAAARTLAPQLFQRPKPSIYRVTCKGAVIDQRTQPQVLKAPCTPDWHHPTAEFLAKQPRDPDALLAKLRNEPLVKGPMTRLQDTREKNTPPDQKAFNRISGALASGILPADLRAALYQAARKIPGIQLLDDVVTLDGRHGRAIGFVYNGYRQDIIISPSNGQSLGSRLVVADTAPLNGESNVSGHLRPGDIYNATSITTQITATHPPTK